MPELCRFGGMIIYMLSEMWVSTTNLMFMYTTEIMKQPLGSMASYLLVHFLVSN